MPTANTFTGECESPALDFPTRVPVEAVDAPPLPLENREPRYGAPRVRVDAEDQETLR